MITDFHHVYSKGEMVIFRDADDYIHFQNRLAIAKFGKNIKIVAFSIMSTHVHLIVETWDEDALNEFISDIKWAYFVHYKRKYGHSLPKEFFHIQYKDEELEYGNKKNQVIYVLKNPLHHQICASIFAYEYSSARYTYLEEMFGEKFSKVYLSGLKKVSELGARKIRQISGFSPLNENTLVDSESGAISPLSFVDIHKARAYWGQSIGGYIMNLHYKPKDSAGEYIDEDALCVQTDKLSDIDVCKIIDDFAKECGVKSFAFLSDEDKARLVRMLYDRFISKAQIERCLWIKL